MGDLLGLPLRSCGDAVRSSATMLGVSWQQLSYNQHRRVDTDTLEWVRINRPCVVEGRYLDRVLAPLGREIILVRLEASDEDRRCRQSAKRGHATTTIEFREREKDDLTFSEYMYSLDQHLTPLVVLNSSELSVEAPEQRIKSLVESFRIALG